MNKEFATKDEFINLSHLYGSLIESLHFKEANFLFDKFEQALPFFSNALDSFNVDFLEKDDPWCFYWLVKFHIDLKHEKYQVINPANMNNNFVKIFIEMLLFINEKTGFQEKNAHSYFPHLGKAGADSGQVRLVRDFNFLRIFRNTTIRDVLLTLSIDDQRRIGLATIHAIYGNKANQMNTSESSADRLI